MATRILLYLNELEDYAVDGIASINKVSRDNRFSIATLEDLVDNINRYKKIDELIIFTHGVRGGLIIDHHDYSLDEQAMKDAFAKTATKIDVIRFEGCWVGEAPLAMAEFGKLFDAKAVSGFTWTCNTVKADIKVPRGATAKDLETSLASYLPWVMPGTTSAALMASAARDREANVTLALFWYRYDLNDDASAAPYMNDNYKKLGRHTYRARNEVAYRTVALAKAENSTAPVPPFENVTVTLP